MNPKVILFKTFYLGVYINKLNFDKSSRCVVTCTGLNSGLNIGLNSGLNSGFN